MRERSWRPVVVVVGATYLVGQDGICHRYRAVLLDNFHVMHLELFLKSSYRVVKRGTYLPSPKEAISGSQEPMLTWSPRVGANLEREQARHRRSRAATTVNSKRREGDAGGGNWAVVPFVLHSSYLHSILSYLKMLRNVYPRTTGKEDTGRASPTLLPLGSEAVDSVDSVIILVCFKRHAPDSRPAPAPVVGEEVHSSYAGPPLPSCLPVLGEVCDCSLMEVWYVQILAQNLNPPRWRAGQSSKRPRSAVWPFLRVIGLRVSGGRSRGSRMRLQIHHKKPNSCRDSALSSPNRDKASLFLGHQNGRLAPSRARGLPVLGR